MQLSEILLELKNIGCCGIKISFEDEGALLNEMITMRNLTSKVGIDLSVKIGGCEAKRDIVDCIHLGADYIVAPMVESLFSLKKFVQSCKQYNITCKKGFNLETITSYKNINDLEKLFSEIDFVVVGRVDLVGSLEKNRDFVNGPEILSIVTDIFKIARKHNKGCYLGGAISIDSKEFIDNLINENLLDKFETRYAIFDTNKISNLSKCLYLANLFEVEWLKYVSNIYEILANKDKKRIVMIENRIKQNIN